MWTTLSPRKNKNLLFLEYPPSLKKHAYRPCKTLQSSDRNLTKKQKLYKMNGLLKSYVVFVENKECMIRLEEKLEAIKKFGISFSAPIFTKFGVCWTSSGTNFHDYFLEHWKKDGIISSYQIQYIPKSSL